jgi:hypothetical protein
VVSSGEESGDGEQMESLHSLHIFLHVLLGEKNLVGKIWFLENLKPVQ